jgi:ketosteroid isomerase-like protein
VGANADILRSVWDAFIGQDFDGAMAHFDAAAEIVAPGTLPWAGTYRGHDGYREMAGKVRSLLDDFRPSPQAFIEDGDQVAVPIDLQGRTTTGTDIAWRALWLYRLRDGKVVRAELFIDTARALADVREALTPLEG